MNAYLQAKYKYEINSQLELEPLRAPTGPGPPRPLEHSTGNMNYTLENYKT